MIEQKQQFRRSAAKRRPPSILLLKTADLLGPYSTDSRGDAALYFNKKREEPLENGPPTPLHSRLFHDVRKPRDRANVEVG